MSKLIYYYGTMNSSKTANLIMTAYNYTSQGRKILCLKPIEDSRWEDGNKKDKKGYIKSRALNESLECFLVSKEDNLLTFFKEQNTACQKAYSEGISAVLIDEAQFLKAEQIKQLADIVLKYGVQVICYGLKNTYIDGKLFEGAEALFYYAQTIIEIKTVCKYCKNKATHNLRVVNGVATYDGSDLAIGDVEGEDEFYAQVCYNHFRKPPAPILVLDSKNKINFNPKLDYILKYNNEEGYYTKFKELDGLKKEEFYFDHETAELEKVKYLFIGNIMFDLYAFSKRKDLPITVFVRALIKVLYDIFEGNKSEAFKLLRDAQGDLKDIQFFDNFEEYMAVREKMSGSSLRRFEQLPDGNYFYNDLHTKQYASFVHTLLVNLAIVCDIPVGVLYQEDIEDGNQISEEN